MCSGSPFVTAHASCDFRCDGLVKMSTRLRGSLALATISSREKGCKRPSSALGDLPKGLVWYLGSTRRCSSISFLRFCAVSNSSGVMEYLRSVGFLLMMLLIVDYDHDVYNQRSLEHALYDVDQGTASSALTTHRCLVVASNPIPIAPLLHVQDHCALVFLT